MRTQEVSVSISEIRVSVRRWLRLKGLVLIARYRAATKTYQDRVVGCDIC